MKEVEPLTMEGRWTDKGQGSYGPVSVETQEGGEEKKVHFEGAPGTRGVAV